MSEGQSKVSSIRGADLDVRAGGVLDWLEVAVAGVPRRHFTASVLRDPTLPGRPPRIGVGCRGGEPLLRRRRVFVVLAVAVFAARRVDDASDVPGGRQHEFDWPAT